MYKPKRKRNAGGKLTTSDGSRTGAPRPAEAVPQRQASAGSTSTGSTSTASDAQRAEAAARRMEREQRTRKNTLITEGFGSIDRGLAQMRDRANAEAAEANARQRYADSPEGRMAERRAAADETRQRYNEAAADQARGAASDFIDAMRADAEAKAEFDEQMRQAAREDARRRHELTLGVLRSPPSVEEMRRNAAAYAAQQAAASDSSNSSDSSDDTDRKDNPSRGRRMARNRTPNHHRTGLIGQDYPIDPYRSDLDKAYDPYDRDWRTGNPSRPPAIPNLKVGDIVTIEDEGGWRTVPYELRVNKVMTTRFEAGRVPFNSYTLREITSGRHGSVSTVVAVNGDPVKGRPTRVRNGDASALADLIAERDFAAMQHRYGSNSRAHDRYEDEHHALTAMIGGRSGRRGKRTRNGGLDGFDLYKEFADEIGTMADRHSILHKYAPSLHKIALSQVGQTGDTPYEQALKNQVLCLWQFLSRHLLPDVAAAVGCEGAYDPITSLPPAADRNTFYDVQAEYGACQPPKWRVAPPDGEASRALDKRLEQMDTYGHEALRQASMARDFLERYQKAVGSGKPESYLQTLLSQPANLRAFRELPIVAAYAVESAALARVPLKVLERAMREGL